MRDSQRQAVYDWENKILNLANQTNGASMTLEECVALVERVWADYHPNVKPPIVLDGRGRRRACGGRWKIKLPRWSRKPIVVLHETAHALQRQQPWHGPEFARLVLELWVRYAGVPKAMARSLGVNQKPRRVRFMSPGKVPQPVTHEWKAWWKKMAALQSQVRELRCTEPPKHGSNGR